MTSGERIWTADEGALGPVQVAGGSLFLVSDQNELVRLDAALARVIDRSAPERREPGAEDNTGIEEIGVLDDTVVQTGHRFVDHRQD